MIKHNPPSAEHLHRAIARFGDTTVLVVGDFILDRFVNGVIERISPEAPIPVLHGRGETLAIGGAGNVVSNIVSLGAAAIPVSVIGDDQAGEHVMRMLKELGVDTRRACQGPRPHDLVEEPLQRAQPAGAAFRRRGDQAARRCGAGDADRSISARRSNAPTSLSCPTTARAYCSTASPAELISICRDAGKPVLVDPKGRDYARYAGATAITPNRKELGEAVGRAVFADDEIVAAARELIVAHGFEFVIATRSEKGMSVVGPHDAWHVATQAREVFDVSGAGDTVIATFALAMAAGADRGVAAFIANAAGGVVVGKRGTARLTVEELDRRAVPLARACPPGCDP